MQAFAERARIELHRIPPAQTFRKLDVTSRTELAPRLPQSGVQRGASATRSFVYARRRIGAARLRQPASPADSAGNRPKSLLRADDGDASAVKSSRGRRHLKGAPD